MRTRSRVCSGETPSLAIGETMGQVDQRGHSFLLHLSSSRAQTVQLPFHAISVGFRVQRQARRRLHTRRTERRNSSVQEAVSSLNGNEPGQYVTAGRLRLWKAKLCSYSLCENNNIEFIPKRRGTNRDNPVSHVANVNLPYVRFIQAVMGLDTPGGSALVWAGPYALALPSGFKAPSVGTERRDAVWSALTLITWKGVNWALIHQNTQWDSDGPKIRTISGSSGPRCPPL